ncbi:MAG: ABC transporter permease [Candidatus Cloacimonetes bacterium]|nr:ABC transporter permease [Candidatus Cloacimonadota bacterium]
MYHLHLAYRYLKGKNSFFLQSQNMLSLLGVIIAVFALLVVISVMNGFDRDIRSRVINARAEILINKSDFSPIKNYREIESKLLENRNLRFVSPVCRNELMIQRKEQVSACINYGVDLGKQRNVTNLLQKMRIGYPTDKELDEDGIIIGFEMAMQLNSTVGDYVNLYSPIASVPTPFGLVPKSKKLKVVGIFSSGMPEYDRTLTFVSLKNGQFFSSLTENACTHIEGVSHENVSSGKVAIELTSELGESYSVMDWSEFEANLFNSIKLEKAVMFLALSLMIIIAAFNMSGNFIKLVSEKRREFGILKAIGLRNNDFMKIFVMIGFLLGLVGIVTGVVLALVFLYLQQKYQLITIPIEGLSIHYLPVEMRLGDFLIAPFITICITVLSALYPAAKTLNIEPVKVIRE